MLPVFITQLPRLLRPVPRNKDSQFCIYLYALLEMEAEAPSQSEKGATWTIFKFSFSTDTRFHHMLGEAKRRRRPSSLSPNETNTSSLPLVEEKPKDGIPNVSQWRLSGTACLAWTCVLLVMVQLSPRFTGTTSRKLYPTDHPALVVSGSHGHPQTILLDDVLHEVHPSALPIPMAPDYGDLDIISLRLAPHFVREVDPDDADYYHEERREFLYEIDDEDLHYSSYDDWDHRKSCRKPKWISQVITACNTVHEQTLMASVDQEFGRMRYVASGHYRDAYVLSKSNTTNLPKYPKLRKVPLDLPIDHVVLKTLRPVFNFTHEDYASIISEVAILDEFTDAPDFADLYGACGTTMLVQAGSEWTTRMIPHHPRYQPMERGTMSLQQLHEYQATQHPGSLNRLSLHDQVLSLRTMTTSLTRLHGHQHGVLVHDDIQPEQWLVAPNGRLFLNDVNNVEALGYNRNKHRYCPFWIQYQGSYRAPEEYRGTWVDESADVWALGNQIYATLTGLWPYFDQPSDAIIRNVTQRGGPQLPFAVHTELAQIMRSCHVLDPKQRPSVFQVLMQLQAIDMSEVQAKA